MTAKSAAATAFSVGDSIVYPAHGVGCITAIENQEVAGYKLELYVVSFEQDRMTLRVPKAKIAASGMRPLSSEATIASVLQILAQRPKRTKGLWAKRALELESKVTSGDVLKLAEVVRDLSKVDSAEGASYSERQIYEGAFDRLMREVAAVRSLTHTVAADLLRKAIGEQPRSGNPSASDVEDEAEAA